MTYQSTKLYRTVGSINGLVAVTEKYIGLFTTAQAFRLFVPPMGQVGFFLKHAHTIVIQLLKSICRGYYVSLSHRPCNR